MRTLEDIERDLKNAETEAEPIKKLWEEAVKKCNQLRDEAEQYKINNGLFHPMEELKNHIGKEISHIKLVEKAENGELQSKDMFNYEMFSVDKNGRLDFSSYEMGIMFWDEEKKMYCYSYHYYETYHDFIGYLDVCFEDDEEREPIE